MQEYEIVQAPLHTLDDVVNGWLEKGWHCTGGPVLLPNNRHEDYYSPTLYAQALVREKQHYQSQGIL